MTQQHELLDAAIKKVGNRYLATMLVAKRMRQLYHGAPPYVARDEDESLFTVALREIAQGHLVLQEHPLVHPNLSTPSSSSEEGSGVGTVPLTATSVETAQE